MTRNLADPETGEVITVSDDQVIEKRAFIDTLRRLESGQILEDLTDDQHALILAMQDTGGNGEIQITISYKQSGPQIAVVGKIKIKSPAAPRGQTLFYADLGNLTRDNPQQRRLDFTFSDDKQETPN